MTGVESLARAVAALLADRPLRLKRAAAAARTAAAGGGVLDAVLGRLSPWLDRIAPMSDSAAAPRSLQA